MFSDEVGKKAARNNGGQVRTAKHRITVSDRGAMLCHFAIRWMKSSLIRKRSVGGPLQKGIGAAGHLAPDTVMKAHIIYLLFIDKLQLRQKTQGGGGIE